MDLVETFRRRRAVEGPVFWLDSDLVVLDPRVAAAVNRANFADFTLNPSVGDQLRGRRGALVDWRDVRAAWLPRIRELTEPEHLRALAERMDRILSSRLDTPLDLVWLSYETAVRSLVPLVIADLDAKDNAILARDLIAKVATLLDRPAPLSIVAQARAGAMVRRRIKRRAAGPGRADLLDPIARELLGVLGIGRAVEATTAMLTAITGPPGSAAASVLFELSRRPEWQERLGDELAAATDLCTAPQSRAPVTTRFVKEVLRMWSPPLLLNRRVRTAVSVEGVELRPGQQYVTCPYLVHHDETRLPDHATFDPDRWLADPTFDYVPFGWAPTTCLGAGIGIAQLILWCRLLTTRYRVTTNRPSRMTMLASPTPHDFRGTVTSR